MNYDSLLSDCQTLLYPHPIINVVNSRPAAFVHWSSGRICNTDFMGRKALSGYKNVYEKA